jgi:hypothetical protein
VLNEIDIYVKQVTIIQWIPKGYSNNVGLNFQIYKYNSYIYIYNIMTVFQNYKLFSFYICKLLICFLSKLVSLTTHFKMKKK